MSLHNSIRPKEYIPCVTITSKMIFDFNPHTGIHVLMQEHGGYYKHPQRSACWSIVLKDLKDTLTFCCHQETIRLHNRWKYLIIMYWIPCNYPWNSVFCGVCVCVWVVFFFTIVPVNHCLVTTSLSNFSAYLSHNVFYVEICCCVCSATQEILSSGLSTSIALEIRWSTLVWVIIFLL